MNKYESSYIKLKNAYYDTEGSAGSIEELYQLKEQLECTDEIAAKRVLVDVYRLLELYKSAYDLLSKIIDKSDKKQLKMLGYIAQYKDSRADKFAVKRPQTAAQKFAHKKKLATLPKFIYHPDPLATGALRFDISVICECCGRKTEVYYDGSIYCTDNVRWLCPQCIADGLAAAKFDATFVQDTEILLDDNIKNDDLFKRTLGYSSWQGEVWLVCCDDYCEFHGRVGTNELEAMGMADEVFAEYESHGRFANVREYLSADGDIAGYLFRCRHCGRWRIWVDAS